MMLVCSSCNSRYLVNSGDLKPDVRVVRCAKCDHEWFQGPNLTEEENLESSLLHIAEEKDNKLKSEKKPITNLPSTYIKEEKASIFNSVLIIFLVALIIFIFWLVKQEGRGIIVLLNFYMQEFYFNFKLIINDFATLIYQIIN